MCEKRLTSVPTLHQICVITRALHKVYSTTVSNQLLSKADDHSSCDKAAVSFSHIVNVNASCDKVTALSHSVQCDVHSFYLIQIPSA